MLKLEEKDYDLNFLFQFSFDFQMLKEILLKLAKSNKDLKSKMSKLEKSNKEKDERISNIEEKLNIVYIPEDKNNTSSDEVEVNLDSKNDNNSNEDEQEDLNNDNNNKDNENKNDNENNNDNKRDTKNKKEKNKKKGEESDEETIPNKGFKRQRSRTIKLSRKNFDNLNTYIGNQVSSQTIKSLLKLIKENTEKISNLERRLNKKITNSLNDLEKQLKDLDNQNTREHKLINSKITDINHRLFDYNDKMDGIIIKTAPLDTLTVIKDSGNGTVDGAKVMVQMLEEKINKKIEIIEKRKKEGSGGDQNYLSLKVDDLLTLTDQLKRDIDTLKGNNKNLNDGNYNDSIKELKDLIDKKNNDLLIIIEELSKKLKGGQFTGDKMDDILNNIKSEKDINKIKRENDSAYKDAKESGEINEQLSDLRQRIKDLNKKLNDIDNYFKNVLNNQGQDIGVIKRKIEEIENKLEKKITKDDLKELYNTTEEHSDELKYLTDKIAELIEAVQKLQDNNPSFIKRLESLTHEVLELKERDDKDIQSKPIDLTKYIDENKLKEALKPYKKNIDILMFEKDSLYNQLKELQEDMKYFDTKERVNKLEEEINERISDFINKFTKKYADRIEISKLFKAFEAQMKLLTESQKNKEAENWILAKQPLGCFNCATCEANIKNLSPTTDYLPWNKYPQGERQYHVGQGFSKLLQRISNDNAFRNFNNEKKEFSSDIDLNSNLYNSMSNIKGNNFVFKINNRETMKEDFNENLLKLNKNYKLPKVLNNKRKKNNHIYDNLPLTDEDNDKDNNNRSYDTSSSPKIMKITKKKVNDLSRQIITNSQQKTLNIDSNSKMSSTVVKSSAKLERVKSMPVYENV